MSTHAPASETADNAPVVPTSTAESKEPETFLAKIYRLAAAGQEDAAMDMIFDHVNALLMAARFDRCDQLLHLIDLGKLPPVLLISFLTITAPAKDKLAERNRFYDMAKREIVRQRGVEAAQRLLVGLE